MENTNTTSTTPTANNKMLELFKKRFAEKDNAKVLSPAEAQKERELAESKKRNLFKLKSAVNSLGIKVNDEEMKMLEAFFTSKDILEINFERIHFLPSAHRRLKLETNGKDIEIRGQNGIYAIIHTDMDDRRTCNVCYPDLDARLRPIDFKYRLETAFKDWIIELKTLKVQGCRVNTDFSERGLEIASEKEYLQEVIKKMMVSEIISQITDAICKSAVYNDIQVNAVMYTIDANNNRIKNYLFSMDPVEYTQKMGAIAVGNRRFDMLQGDVEVVDLTIKNGETLEDCRVACIDPEQPSLYLHKGKNGYHINLYIPEEIMQVFFNV